MLSREERILSQLLVSRGVTSREVLERCARLKETSPEPISLVDALIETGGVERAWLSSIAEEARALDEALEPSLPGGGKLGEFRIVREIGRGGMGIVFEAVQESLGRRVALKILPAGAALDDRLATRFLREARATGRLQHPGLVPIFSSGHAEGVLYFAMELIEGHSLGEEVARGPVAPERAARIVAQVAHAAEHAHQAGLVHRDIKPENVLIGPDDRPRLTDFGLVHEPLADSFTLSLHVLGTPAYIPPEQAMGEPVDRRSDVYSLGAVLYALLCGKPPYAGGVPFLVLARVLDKGPPALATVRPEVPPDLAAICERAMARQPDHRYAQASAMAEDLERFLRGEKPEASTAAAAAKAIAAETAAADRSVSPRVDGPESLGQAPKSEDGNTPSGDRNAQSGGPIALRPFDPGQVAHRAQGGGVALMETGSAATGARLITNGSGAATTSAATDVSGAATMGAGRAAHASGSVTTDVGPFRDASVAATFPGASRIESHAPRRSGLSLKATLSICAAGVLIFAVAGLLVVKSKSSGALETPLNSPSEARGGDGTSRHSAFGPAFRLVNRTPGRKAYPTLSPDGRELAYLVVAGKNETVFSQRLADGHVDPLAATGVAGGPLAFSPDGQFLALHVFSSGRSALSLLDLRNQGIRFVSYLSGYVAWSPDGGEMVVGHNMRSWGPSATPGTVENTELVAIDVATGRARTLRSGALSAPSYSPHGRRIAFASRSGGQIDIWTVARGGGEMARATDDQETDWNPVWSGDGKHLYFGSERDGRRGVWRVAVDEETGRPLGPPEPVSDAVFAAPFFLALSADGRTMAVVPVAEKGLLVRLELAFDSSGKASSARILPRFSAFTDSAGPSPDGRMLAVTARSPQEDIAVVASDGASEPRFLTDDSFRDGDPRWSPDGTRIAFHSDRSGRMEIWTIRPDGSGLHQVTHAEGRGATSPVWSPQSDRIAYSVEEGGAFMIRDEADADRKARTVPAPLPEPLAPSGAGSPRFVPSSWAPDGATLAGSMGGIVLYEIGPRRYRRLTTFGRKPVWLPDGQRLLFTDDRKIYVLSTRTGASHEIYSAEPNDPLSSIALTSDGRAIYTTLASSGEEIWIATVQDSPIGSQLSKK